MKNNNTRDFLNNKIRAVWDAENNKWWYSAFDIAYAITGSINPRIYWNALKRRHNELSTFCRQLKLYANDGKQYMSDVIDENGIRRLRFIIRFPENSSFYDWVNDSMQPIDIQAKQKAYQLFNNDLIEESEIGKLISLKKIHAFLYEGIYDKAGTTRIDGVINDDLGFDDFLMDILIDIVFIPDDTFENIIDKFIQMTNVRPFDKYNNVAIRIWLDLMLKKNIGKCIDWSKINKNDYKNVIENSFANYSDVLKILSNALTDDINNEELFIKGIDASFELDDN